MGTDHETIVRLHTPERYVLGELSPPEREEFEDHLADCRFCLEDLAAADMFAANASAVYADEAVQKAAEKSRGWLDLAGLGFLRPRAFPALAFSGVLNLALLAMVGYGVTRTGPVADPRPVVSEVFAVRPPARAGQSQVCAVGKSKSFATLQFDLAQPYRRYSYSLEGAGQDLTGQGSVDSADTLSLTVPLAGLKPGDHKFRVTGQDGQNAAEIGECILRVDPEK